MPEDVGFTARADVSLSRSMPDRYVLQARARAMRRQPTLAEKTLWKLLRDRRLSGLKFRRQTPIGPYIADFACFSPRLIVEPDGKAHWNPDYDATRDLVRGTDVQGPTLSE
jgi:very-short-patch-repair endonuclease